MKSTPSVVPFLMARDPVTYVAFLQSAFGASVVGRSAFSSGAAALSELQIGSSHLLVGKRHDDEPAHPMNLMVRVTDPEATTDAAVRLGARALDSIGDLRAIRDPEGNEWVLAKLP